MEQLERQVRQARWWLGVQRFLGVLGWCCFAAMVVALAVIVVDKFWPTGVAAWIWGTGAVGLGLATALGWAVLRGRGPLEAALEIDRRCGLKERVSSTLSMSDEDRHTAAGEALQEDALRRVRRVDVGEHFRVSPGRQIFLPLVPAVLAVLVVLFIHPAGVENPAAADSDVKKQIDKSAKSLRQKLLEQRKLAEEKGLKDAQHLFEQLEEGVEELTAKNPGDRKRALVKLNDLARELQERRQRLGGAENIQKQLKQLKSTTRGPADKFLQQIKQGDFKKALDELKKLRDDLAAGKLGEEEQAALAKQLAEMQQKLQDLVDAHREAEKDLEKRLQQARQEGREGDAEKLQQQLNKLQQQLPQMNQLEDLANKLGQCANCLQDGQLQNAEGLLGQLQADLNGLQQEFQELDLLDQAMEGLGECRNQMNCGICGGAGCGACQGEPGVGMGEGRGIGPRPEEETDVGFRPSNVPQKVGPGAASVVGEADGPNIPGSVQQRIQEQYDSPRHEAADPLAGRRMPRSHREHAREYFDRFQPKN